MGGEKGDGESGGALDSFCLSLSLSISLVCEKSSLVGYVHPLLLPVSLGRQLQLLPLEHLGDVQVEEVAVQHGLDAPGHDRDDVVKA